MTSGRQASGEDKIRVEDLVVVTKDGYENLARWPEDKITECWI